MFLFFRQIRRRIRRHQPFYWFIWLLVAFAALFLIHMVLFVHAEQVSWNEGLWQTWQTFTTVGYGNRPAETLAGRATSMIFSTLGIAVMGSLFAASFDLKLYFNNLRRYGQMKNPFQQGYVVVHFPGEDDLATFVNEIRSFEPDVGICILDPNLCEIPARLSHIRKLHLVRGSTTSRESFDKARLRDAKTVVVFAPQIDIAGADAMTKTVVSLIGNYLEGSQTRMIHLLEDAQNSWMFADESSVQIVEDLDILAAVQECSDPYSSQMVESLLRNSDGPSIKTVPASDFLGLSWHQLCQRFLKLAGDQGTVITPIGLIRGGKAITCPSPEEKILSQDYCAFVCPNNIDWNATVAQLPNN